MGILRKGITPLDAARRGRWFSVGFIGLGLFLVWAATQKVQRNAEVLAHPETTVGSITYVRLKGRYAPSLSYVYEANGRQYSGIADPNTRPNYRQEPQVGDTVAVTYSALHPDWSIAGDLHRQPDYYPEFGWVLVALAVVGSLACQLVVTRLERDTDVRRQPL